uniref:Uncharacterized protein n=1 Tax=Sphaerodactylus townsendi TaxID=933632 RepID=A0ACB8GA85_9SAUR
MPAPLLVLLLLRTLLTRLLLVARQRLLPLLRRLGARLTSQQSRQAVLTCLLCVLNLRKKASPEPSEGRFNSASPTEDGVTNEDRVNRNSLSRSIKKITLSDWGQHGESCLSEEGVLRDPVHASCERNFNNNNCRPGKAQFRDPLSPVPCDETP